MMEAIIGGKSDKEAMWAGIGIEIAIDLVIECAVAAIKLHSRALEIPEVFS